MKQLISILVEDISELETFSEKEIGTLVERLIKGEPIQYVTGVAPFYGYFFEVSKDVLIPRPETEELVYAVEKFVKRHSLHKACILDIGTGSGCIPITLSKLFPKATITGIDVSEEALNIARRNNTKITASADFLNADFLTLNHFPLSEKVNIIISNPPYIPDQERSLLSSNVIDHEPHLALFVEDADPLIFYNKIYDLSLKTEQPLAIFLECNEYNAPKVARLFQDEFDVELIKDLQGKDRIVKASRGYVI